MGFLNKLLMAEFKNIKTRSGSLSFLFFDSAGYIRENISILGNISKPRQGGISGKLSMPKIFKIYFWRGFETDESRISGFFKLQKIRTRKSIF